MDREAWGAIVHGVARVRHDLATKPPPPKDDAVKVLHSTCQQIWKTQQWPQDWKRSVSILIPKKGNAKEGSNYHTIALISHTSNAQNSPSQASARREP